MKLPTLRPTKLHQSTLNNLQKAVNNRSKLGKVGFTVLAIATGSLATLEHTADVTGALVGRLRHGPTSPIQSYKVNKLYRQIVGILLCFLSPVYGCHYNLQYQLKKETCTAVIPENKLNDYVNLRTQLENKIIEPLKDNKNVQLSESLLQMSLFFICDFDFRGSLVTAEERDILTKAIQNGKITVDKSLPLEILTWWTDFMLKEPANGMKDWHQKLKEYNQFAESCDNRTLNQILIPILGAERLALMLNYSHIPKGPISVDNITISIEHEYIDGLPDGYLGLTALDMIWKPLEGKIYATPLYENKRWLPPVEVTHPLLFAGFLFKEDDSCGMQVKEQPYICRDLSPFKLHILEEMFDLFLEN